MSTVGRQSFLVVGLDVALSVFRLRRVGLLQVWAASGSPRCRRVVSDSSYFDCGGSAYGFCGHFDPSSSAALSVICGRFGCCCGSPSCYVMVGWWSPSYVCSRPPCCSLLPDPLSFAEAVFWSVGRLPCRQVPSSFMPCVFGFVGWLPWQVRPGTGSPCCDGYGVGWVGYTPVCLLSRYV